MPEERSVVEHVLEDGRGDLAVPPEVLTADDGCHVCPPRRGRRRSRSAFNARKHGIFVTVLSGPERRRLNRLIARFAEDLRPVGPTESLLVEKIALASLRLQRCAMAEAVYYEGVWGPQAERRQAGRRQRVITMRDVFNEECFEKTVTLIGRYDTTLTNQFLKLLRELTSLQVARKDLDAAERAAGDAHHAAQDAADGHATRTALSSVETAALQKRTGLPPHPLAGRGVATEAAPSRPPAEPFQGIPGGLGASRTDDERDPEDDLGPSMHGWSRSKYGWL